MIGLVAFVGLAARNGSTRTAAGNGPQAPTAVPASGQATGSSSAPATATATRMPPLPQKVARLADNPVFTAGALPAVPCALPAFGADPGVQAVFYLAAIDCMNRAWLPVLTRAGLPADLPELLVPTGPYNTPCGNKAATDNPNYCEGVIYMPPRYFAEVERAPSDRIVAYLGVLAHEYGHHVQELAGVMDAAWAQRYEAGLNTPIGLEVSRRNELGASCFGGMFLAGVAGQGSVSRELAEQILRDQGRRGDRPDSGLPADHGTPASNAAWYAAGYQQNSAAACNTWVVPAPSVS